MINIHLKIEVTYVIKFKKGLEIWKVKVKN